ncbi:hypothetical protein DIGNKC_163 [Bacillus phage DIGNKC]|nr:hypothetical protein BI007_gp211 [Bacillus phage DIGNKC]AMW62890.1 hypothetical protein DIGNKC_163 [Bacillus phage DIGNKC]AOZ62407.1 hypothetical protein SBP8a_157 [Bacillus phage SBP8a]UGO46407.1 hypothetical protein ABINADI_90 [Bacillus phage vB_BanH_Abinadi]
MPTESDNWDLTFEELCRKRDLLQKELERTEEEIKRRMVEGAWGNRWTR